MNGVDAKFTQLVFNCWCGHITVPLVPAIRMLRSMVPWSCTYVRTCIGTVRCMQRDDPDFRYNLPAIRFAFDFYLLERGLTARSLVLELLRRGVRCSFRG